MKQNLADGAPDWNEILNGTTEQPDKTPTGHRRGHARHAAANAAATTGEHILQCSIGIVFTIVIILIAQVGWMFVGHDLDTIRTQEADARRVGIASPATLNTTRIAQPQTGEPPVDATPSHAEVIGWMYIPGIETGWKRAIQQGTDQIVLDNQGIGHYEQTVMPGAIGNSAYAGHRTGGDLGYIDRLHAGDAIVLQTAEHWYVYRMASSRVVDPSDVSVLDNDKNNPNARELTLTTCHPMSVWADQSIKHRYVVRAEFSYWANVSDGIPVELSTADKSPVGKLGYRISKTVRTVGSYAPASMVFAGLLLAVWVLLNGAGWLLWRGERGRQPPTWNILALSWRLQQGGRFLRILNMLVFWSMLVLAFWWLASPRFNDWLPFLQALGPSGATL